MSEIGEKITYNIIGGICGVAFGLIIKSFNFSLLQTTDTVLLLIITGLFGILFFENLLEYKKAQEFVVIKKIRDETVALITHEMRTGLTSTSWAIQVILESYQNALSPEHREMLQNVTKSINTTVMHSVNLLDISLLDVGKLTLSLQWVTLGELEKGFKEILHKYELGTSQAGITLTSKVVLDPKFRVQADLLRLRITLENLLENAIQYTLRPEKKINVDIHNNSSTLFITVSDTGIGIPPEEKHKIFSEFFRASNARMALSHGSGIGLHMCEEYIRAHHGTIRFESKVNEGTTFYITLPLRTVADVNEFLTKI